MKAVDIIGEVREGHLPPHQASALARALRLCEGKLVCVRLSLGRKQRSRSQNAFYWSEVVPTVRDLFREHGTVLSDDECHEYLKEHVFGWTRSVTDPSGLRRKVVGSSVDKTVAEWEEAMERARAWAAPFGCYILRPNEPPTERMS